jgi:SMODS-associating 4TM effector domain
LILFFSALATDLKVVDLATVLTPAAPVLIWALRENFRQRDAAEANEFLKREAENLFERAKTGQCDEVECGSRSREFQDGIYGRRAANPLIFPFIYAHMRTEMETRMNAGADELLKDLGIVT